MNTKTLILICTIAFILVSIISFALFLFGMGNNFNDLSFEMHSVIESELILLETDLKKNGIISKEVAYHKNKETGEYWIDDDITSDFNGVVYGNMGFTYEQLSCEVYIVYQEQTYTVEISLGNTNLLNLTDKSKEGARKILNIFNSFCETESFTPSVIEKNYSDTYFANHYESEKYEAYYSNKQYGINEMCSYEVMGKSASYTYFCSKNPDGELFPCQISIAYDRTADESLVLEKGGDGND